MSNDLSVGGWRFVAAAVLLGLSGRGVGGAAETGERVLTDVHARGADKYFSYRIPAILLSRQGTLPAFSEGRKTSNKDHGDIDLGAAAEHRRRTDLAADADRVRRRG